MFDLIQKEEKVYGALGIHPLYAKEFTTEVEFLQN